MHEIFLRPRRLFSAALLVFLSGLPAFSQSERFELVLGEILSNSTELFTYRDIPIDWKMKGRAQAEFNEGLNNLTEGNTRLALENFNAAIKEDNSFWQVYYYRGIAYKKLRKFDEAKKDLKLLVDGDKERYFSQIELGKISRIQRDIDESDRYFNKAMRSSDQDAYAQYLRANNQLTRGLEKLAANGYRDCLKKDSMMYDAMVRLALVSSKKSLTDGVPYLNRVLRHDSLHVNALLLRGLARSSDNKALAIRDFSNLLVKDPTMVIGRYLRGIVYCDMGDFDRAFTDLHKLVEGISSDENEFQGQQTWTDKKIDIQNLGDYTVSRVYGLPESQSTELKKAYCLLVSDQYEKCIGVIDALSIAKTEPLCLYLKAISMEHSQKHAEAFELYNSALLLDNDIVDAHKKRGIYYQEMKQWDKSIQDFDAVLKLRPETLIAYKARGVSYFNSGRSAQAALDYNQYLKRDSTDVEVIQYRGFSYLHQGDIIRGALDLINAGRSASVDIKYLSHCLDSIVRGGDTLKMITVMNKITSKVPWFTEIYALKIRLLIAKGRWDLVNKEIENAVTNRRINGADVDYSYLLTVKAMSKCKAKQYEEAIVIFTQAIAADRNNALAFLERGRAYSNVGKSGKAISDLNKAAALGHKDAGDLLASIKRSAR